MKVRCKKCREEIPGANIDLTRNIAKCDACGEVFNCEMELAGIASSAFREPSVCSRPDIAVPKGVTVGYENSGLKIRRRWFHPAILALLVFCVFWDGFMIVWYTIAIMKQQWGMAAFGTIHALVGVGLTYGVLCGFLNRTDIRVTFNRIQITHGPLPVPGSRDLTLTQNIQLYTRRQITHSRNGTSVFYQLWLRRDDGKAVKLLDRIPQQEHCLYLEQQIERYLGVSDRAVEEEVERV